MTESQKQFLKAKGFKVRKQPNGANEWYLPTENKGEIMVNDFGCVYFHFYNECYCDFLRLDSICNQIDYYKNKLDEIELL